jgi:signal transduction histidine kinase
MSWASPTRAVWIVLLLATWAGAQATPTITIAEAKHLAETRGDEHPSCVVRGTVTAAPGGNTNAPANFIIQDEAGSAMVVRTATLLPLKIWQTVEVRGTLYWNPLHPKEAAVDESLGIPSIQATEIVPLRISTQIQGKLLSRADARRGLYPIELVRVRGTVMRVMVGDSSIGPGDTVDYVVIGPEPELWAMVRRARSEPSWLKEQAIPGSEVELNGVLSFSSGAQEFRIRLRVPTDLAIIRPHSWFTVAHVLWVVGGLICCALIALAWIISLKRTVHRRTAQIQQAELQLRHAQKMEVIAQLASGVAHDFNNILMAINGYSELLLDENLDEEQKRIVEQILKAGQRAAGLTRKLQAFSRKQALDPALLDLNRFLDVLRPKLQSVLGEHVQMNMRLGIGAMTITADSSQLEDVLIDLTANARDAMRSRGTLIVSTEEVTITNKTDGIAPGHYVVLSFEDTGHGMDSATVSRIFEPFFTTKEIGKGSGLGLSTVYGIVRQNQGEIKVHSVVGRGTTFKVYLPYKEGVPDNSSTQGLLFTPQMLG